MSPDHENAPPLTRKQERLLVKLASETSRVDRPNPQRRDCPGPAVLKAVADRQLIGEELGAAVDHIANCSPCFVEYEQLRQSKRTRHVITLAVVIAVVGLALLVGTRSMKESDPTVAKQPKVETQAPSAQLPSPVAVVLDLRNRGPRRGGPPAPNASIPALPRGLLDLQVQLPNGSEEGRYEVAIYSSGQARLGNFTGTVVFRNRMEVLSVRMDTAPLSAGNYELQLRPVGGAWQKFQVVIQ